MILFPKDYQLMERLQAASRFSFSLLRPSVWKAAAISFKRMRHVTAVARQLNLPLEDAAEIHHVRYQCSTCRDFLHGTDDCPSIFEALKIKEKG